LPVTNKRLPQNDEPAQNPEVSILILTHNASRYVRKTLKSLRLTKGVNFEVVVVDNASNWPLRIMLLRWQHLGWIDKLCLLNYNSLFARGNNIASRLATPSAPYLLLLNSDIEVRNEHWLRKMIDVHQPGMTAYGVVQGDPITRVDGYCLLVDSKLYRDRMLDESFQWFWSVTKMQAQILSAGCTVQGFVEHESLLHHFGGKSGKGYRGAKGMDMNMQDIIAWFEGHTVTIFDSISS